MNDVIERVARAYDAARCATHGPSCPPMSETNLRTIMPMIAAALSALRAGDTLPGGLVVMPRELTAHMLAAALPRPDSLAEPGDMKLAAEACLLLSGGANIPMEGDAVQAAATMISDYRALRNASALA